MIVLTLFATLGVSFSPPAPTVGDPIAIQFSAPVVLEPSADYEIVSQQGTRAVVRTFTPQPLALRGTAGGVRYRGTIPIQSVLKPNDDFKPAPLAAPQPLAYPRAPFVAIAIAALLAIVAWTLVWLRRTKAAVVIPEMPADERFRRAVLALRENGAHPLRWAALADATRTFLAETRPHLGSELTTTELVPRVADHADVVIEILRRGDVEKFSPWGRAEGDFEVVAHQALELAPHRPSGHLLPAGGEKAGLVPRPAERGEGGPERSERPGEGR